MNGDKHEVLRYQKDRSGFCRFMAFGRAVASYLEYKDGNRTSLDGDDAAATVEKLMKDAQQSKREANDMLRRLRAIARRFKRCCEQFIWPPQEERRANLCELLKILNLDLLNEVDAEYECALRTLKRRVEGSFIQAPWLVAMEV